MSDPTRGPRSDAARDPGGDSAGDTVRLARPEVVRFVAQVRAQLADLDAEEQQELTDGLEADLGDLVAEHGPEALGDPLAYARELRGAAGLDPVSDPGRDGGPPPGERIGARLDAAGARWAGAVSGLPGHPWELARSLQPVWWVGRAWVAVEMLDLLFGRTPYGVVPALLGLGWLVTAVAVVLSVQVGRGRLWPGTPTRGPVAARLLLLGLNVLAVLLVQVVLSSLQVSSSYAVPASDRGVPGHGLMVDDAFVENVYPYDAQGRPLTGVQLFDQAGRPLEVTRDPSYVEDSERYRVTYPWRNGATATFNVFPLPERLQADPERAAGAFDDQTPPRILTPPLAAAPPVSLPGVRASVTQQRPGGAPSGRPAGRRSHGG